MSGIDPRNQIDVTRRFLHILALLQNAKDPQDWNATTLSRIMELDRFDGRVIEPKTARDYIEKIEKELGIPIEGYKGGRRYELESGIDTQLLTTLLLTYSGFVVFDASRHGVYSKLAEQRPDTCLWLLARIFFASKKGRLISFSYTNNKMEEKSYTVAPYHLVFRGSNLYLACRKAGEEKVRLFIVGRIDNLKVLDDMHFEPEQTPSAESLFEHSLTSFISEQCVDIVLRYRPTLENVMCDTFSGLNPSFNDKGEWREMSFSASDPLAICRQLVLYGDEVEIVYPPDMRTMMAEMLRRSLKVYEP